MADRTNPTYFYPAPRTPIVESAALPQGHRPLGTVTVDGRDVTRELALFAVRLARETVEDLPASVSAEDYMRQMLAAANHDLACYGYPLISEDDVLSADNPIEAVAAPNRVDALRQTIMDSHQKFLATLRRS